MTIKCFIQVEPVVELVHHHLIFQMAQYTKVSSTCRARNFLRKTINANEKKEGAKNDPCGTPENTAWAEITSCVVDDYLLSSVRKIASSSNHKSETALLNLFFFIDISSKVIDNS